MPRYFQPLVLAVALACGFLFPQLSLGIPPGTGNDSPNGVTGEYNGSITTGGSYDPYTGNAKRFVTDLTVTGSLGAYPLKWTRVLNTRGVPGIGFGHGGTWKHSYSWGLTVRPYRPWHYYPDEYVGPDGAVTYPDGRQKQLNVEPDHSFYWFNENVEPDDQLVPAPEGNGHYDLILADGGRVEFRHDFPGTPSDRTYFLTARRIIDPHGLVTVLERDSSNRLKKIIEPGGRYLEITYEQRYYNTITTDLIFQVKAYASLNQLTETVTYDYTNVNVGQGQHYHLTGVNYADGHPASYTYWPAIAPPEFPTSFVPGRIRTCNDPRFAGAMSKIEYVYAEYSGINGQVAIGQIKGEKYPGTSTFVSEVEYPPVGVPYAERFVRTERRADGSERTFQYSINGDAELEHYTDFKGRTSIIDFPPGGTVGGYLKTFTDALNRTTTVEKDNVTGAVLKTTYHDGNYVLFNYHDPNNAVGNAHYLFSKTDENEKVTYYDRDGAKRIWRTRYPDGGSEEFTYNDFNQITSHLMTSGGTEEFRYDGRGLKRLSWPPWTSSDTEPENHPTQYFYYLTGLHTDRLHYVIDPRGNRTWYEYNGRGQVTKVTHEDLTFTESQYKSDGTLEWTRDELGHQTTYVHDEYKRLTRVTNHLNQSVSNSYDPWASHGPLSHTTSSIYRTETHLGKKVDHDYDENFRRKWTKQAPESQEDVALTEFTYDLVGNLETTKDPRGKITTFGYDYRNRQTSVRNNDLDQTTFVVYDPAGNKERETRPDGGFRTWKYDEMNRVEYAHDWRANETARANQTTTYVRDHAGNATSITDTKGAVYGFVFDDLNRKEIATYPTDANGAARTETWHYDHAGNLDWYKNPAGQKKNIQYDTRNRAWHSSWDGGTSVGQEIVTDYDAAGRVEWIETRENGNMLTRIAYGYDDANRKIWEDQTLAGHPTRRVRTDLDDDGRRQRMEIVAPPQEGGGGIVGLIVSPEMAGTGRYSLAYTYTERNQLKQISGEDWEFNYFYDPSGNMTTRQAVYNGRSSTIQCPTASYDALNRPTRWEQSGPEGFQALSHYRYDRANREEATWREEENGLGEHFQYDVTNQLKRVSYNGAIPSPSPTPVPTPSPTGTPTPPPPPSPTAPPQQLAVWIDDDGNAGNGQVVDVTMNTDTAGATILYTIGEFTSPTHDGNGGPTGNTMVYSGSPLHVGTEQHLYFRALAHKVGMIDSEIAYWDVDNREVGGGVAPMPGQRVVTYKYTPDKLNRHSMTDSASGQTTSYTSSLLNQYASVAGIGYNYDTKFNLTSGEGFSGTYDAANRLVGASNSAMAASPEVELVYDGLGRCVRRTIQGVATIIIYDDWKPIAEWDGWTEEYFQAWNVYGPGADEILLRQGGKWGYVRYHPDANGNIAFLLDNDGQLVEKYTYDVFGRPKITDRHGNPRASSHYDNRFLFQGREYIGEVGVYDYRHRFYHPGLGRFLQKDPTGFDAGDMNLFRYCGDDPIDGSDPTGLGDQDDPRKISRPLTSSGGGDWDWFNGRVGLDQMVQPAGNQSSAVAPQSEGAKSVGFVGLARRLPTKQMTSKVIRKVYQSYMSRGKKTGNYITVIRFKYTVIVNGKPVGQGVRIDEDVSFKDGVDVAPQGPNESWTTNSRGEAFDDYSIPFRSERGSVRIVQPLTVGGKLGGEWETIVRGNGSYNMSSEAKTEQEGDTMLLSPR